MQKDLIPSVDMDLELLKEIIFNDEMPDWIVEDFKNCLDAKPNSYNRMVLANKFLNQIEHYLKSI